MKKLLSVFVLVICAVFSGCAVKTPSEVVQGSLALPISITVESNGATLCANISETDYEVAYLSPSGASGLTVSNDQTGCRAAIGDFERDVDEKMFPAARALVNALRAVNSAEKAANEREGSCEYAIDEMKIMVYYDLNSGLITDIETEDTEKRFDYRVITVTSDERTGEGAGQS